MAKSTYRVDVNLQELEKKFSRSEINRAVKKALGKAARAWQRETTKRHLSGQSSSSLGRRTGALARSINYKLTNDSVRVGFGLGYWRIHEFGGTITGDPYLTIPLDAVKTKSGVQRETYDQAKNRPGAFVIQSRSNPDNKVLVQPQGAGLLPLYALVREVVIPARTDHIGTFEDVAPGIFAWHLKREFEI